MKKFKRADEVRTTANRVAKEIDLYSMYHLIELINEASCMGKYEIEFSNFELKSSLLDKIEKSLQKNGYVYKISARHTSTKTYLSGTISWN